ncbi:MAG: hypothetical protein AAFX86_03355 [Pseudomonadota bacterium]
MKTAFAALTLTLFVGTATAQQYASADDYRTCPAAQTSEGLSVVESTCGKLTPPAFGSANFNSLFELERAEAARDAFTTQVAEYGNCVSRFIDSYRRPGADANSTAPDKAACAHSWAQDQIVQATRDYGRACIEFSNRSMVDATIEPWSGACYPAVPSQNG